MKNPYLLPFEDRETNSLKPTPPSRWSISIEKPGPGDKLVPMTRLAIRSMLALAAFTFAMKLGSGQDNVSAEKETPSPKKVNSSRVPDRKPVSEKPYRILTSGKQITIRSTKDIKDVMLWTSSGNRVVEQREINENSYTINITINEKIFFLMVGLNDGKIYTEKIGIR